MATRVMAALALLAVIAVARPLSVVPPGQKALAGATWLVNGLPQSGVSKACTAHVPDYCAYSIDSSTGELKVTFGTNSSVPDLKGMYNTTSGGFLIRSDDTKTQCTGFVSTATGVVRGTCVLAQQTAVCPILYSPSWNYLYKNYSLFMSADIPSGCARVKSLNLAAMGNALTITSPDARSLNLYGKLYLTSVDNFIFDLQDPSGMTCTGTVAIMKQSGALITAGGKDYMLMVPTCSMYGRSPCTMILQADYTT